MDLQKYRDLYPHLAQGFVHLNHAGVSPLALPVADAMKAYIDGMTLDPVSGGMLGWGQYNDCRSAYARLMGVPSVDVALTKNTAHGVSIVADGLKWREGDEVIFADCEYPANSYPWLAQRDRGVVCKTVSTPESGRLSVDDYAALVTSRTRVIAVSWVQFATGYRADLQPLADLAHAHGALFAVDVIQGLGTRPIDLSAIGADIASTGSQKWLMGPVGVGALYINPQILDQVRNVNMGALSVTNPFAFDPLGFDPKTTAQRYEEGTPNVPGAVGVLAAIKLLEEVGLDVIANQIETTTRYAMDGLAKLGYQVTSPQDDDSRAGIVLFQHPTKPNDEILAALKHAKVNVVDRGGKVRFAPHYYNTLGDIDQALEAIR